MKRFKRFQLVLQTNIFFLFTGVVLFPIKFEAKLLCNSGVNIPSIKPYGLGDQYGVETDLSKAAASAVVSGDPSHLSLSFENASVQYYYCLCATVDAGGPLSNCQVVHG
jgi:hypothetical protein